LFPDILIGQIDNLLKRIRAYVEHQHPDVPGQWDLGFHVYGKGQSGPNGPGELFIVGETIAPTQQLATSLAAKARIAMIVSIAIVTSRFVWHFH
jgi:hypothetical protein